QHCYDATAYQVALMADASASFFLPSASENAEITFTASSFHFFDATFSSYDSGGLKKYFPCSHISLGKVIRSCMSPAIAIAFSRGHAIPSTASESSRYEASVSGDFRLRYC